MNQDQKQCTQPAYWSILVVAVFLLVGTSANSNALAPRPDAMGPLRVCLDNSRYFCDPFGETVFLAGSHTWNNLVDMGAEHPPPVFDFEQYLDFLDAHNHNVTRIWTWEVAQPEDVFDTPLRQVAAPLPWPRSGPNMASDGLPRFDLNRLNPEYFNRLKRRVGRARERGFYVVIMLFEGWSVNMSAGRNSHPFHPDNNINDTEFLAKVEDIHTLKHPEILAIQQRYVEEVIHTVAGMDHLLFEIVNESGGYSTAWQYHMIDFVRSQLEEQGDAAPVGMSFQAINGDNRALFASSADWISPGGKSQPGFYRTRPPAATGDKVVIADTDHIRGSSLFDPVWPYKALLSGLNILYMDRYHGPTSVSTAFPHPAPGIRSSMGISRLVAELLDIGTGVPNPKLSSTRYALHSDDWLLVLAPDAKDLQVDLYEYEGTMQVEWFDTLRNHVIDGDAVEGGGFAAFYPPIQDGALLYIKRAGTTAPTLHSIASEARAVARASLQYAEFRTWLRLKVTPWLSTASRTYSNLAMTLLAAGLAGVLAGLLIACLAYRIRGRQK